MAGPRALLLPLASSGSGELPSKEAQNKSVGAPKTREAV